MRGALLEPLGPPAAGAWIRMHCGRHRPCSDHPDGWATTRWHLSTGDLRWRPAFAAGPAVVTACGYETGTLGGSFRGVRDRDMAVSVDTPPDACRRCLRAR